MTRAAGSIAYLALAAASLITCTIITLRPEYWSGRFWRRRRWIGARICVAIVDAALARIERNHCRSVHRRSEAVRAATGSRGLRLAWAMMRDEADAAADPLDFA